MRWEYPFELTPETKIEEDLGITGIEAFYFIEAFREKFDVDISQFQIANYFETEGDWILPNMIYFFRGKKIREKMLTLGDLEKAIKLKILQ